MWLCGMWGSKQQPEGENSSALASPPQHASWRCHHTAPQPPGHGAGGTAITGTCWCSLDVGCFPLPAQCLAQVHTWPKSSREAMGFVSFWRNCISLNLTFLF